MSPNGSGFVRGEVQNELAKLLCQVGFFFMNPILSDLAIL